LADAAETAALGVDVDKRTDVTNPTVTIVLYARNEQRFVQEAVASVFAQTYSPLEIVLSDDGSTDETFEIMRRAAEAYDGPHTIILNRNPTNIGIGSQINAAWRRGTGELIVLANADDIQLPHRVDRIVDCWRTSGRRAAAIASSYEIMDADGTPTGRVVEVERDFSDIAQSTYDRFGGPGAVSLCVSRECFERFGALAENLILEDGPMNLRARLTGEWRFIDEPLVLYRVHAGNISQAHHLDDFETWRTRHRARACWQMREGERAFVQMLSDLYSSASATADAAAIRQARVNAARRLLDYQIRASYYTGEWEFGIWNWLKFIAALLFLAVKLRIKMAIPLIERRNDRWHHRSVSEAAAGAEDGLRTSRVS
jgi:glycosyltransferase involved in cell wall biosynthesis